MTDKAVILARGLGTRMRKEDGAAQLSEQQSAAADTGVKAMIPIGRPFLDYVLSALADAGYREVCLVIGPEHQVVRDYYTKTVSLKRIRISFAVQAEPRGTADAVAATEEFAGGGHFLMINSDNYYPVDACRALRELGGAGVALFERDAMIRQSNIPPDRIAKFAAAIISADGFMERIMEKPDAATIASLGPEVYIGMNCWMMPPAIFEACRKIKPSPRGEYEVPDAVQYAIDVLGEKFRALKFRAAVLDMSSRTDIAGVGEKLAKVEVRL